MQDLVIVIPDLYFPPGEAEAPSTRSGATGSSPQRLAAARTADTRSLSSGFGHATRFGEKVPLTDGWRSWLARWVGREDLGVAAPAAIAASAVTAPEEAGLSAWLATPMYLIAGLTSIHADRRSLLRLPAADLARFARDFVSTFPGNELVLKPTSSGEFIMLSASVPQALTNEPARALVTNLNEVLPTGAGAASLKRLGAELEMWLHSHPLNHFRQQRGELPVSTLWLWGGGELKSLPAPSVAATVSDLAYGTDSYLTGLWHLLGSAPLPVPDNLSDVIANSRAPRAVLVTEVTPLLHAHPEWTVLEALAELDRRFLSPALAGVRQGRIEQLTLLLNDRRFLIRARDRLKFWRRGHPGLEGLQ